MNVTYGKWTNECIKHEVAQQIKVNVQNQNVNEHVVHKDLATPSNTHQMTPQILSQQWVMNIHNGGNNKLVQNIDEVVSTQ